MAISTIGVSSAASTPSVGAPAGMGLLIGGTITTGKLNNPLTLRAGTYNLQSSANSCALTWGGASGSYANRVNVGTTTTFSIASNFNDGRILTAWGNGVSFPSGWFPYGILFANNLYLVGATNGTTNAIYTSTDRVTWTQRVTGLAGTPVSIAFGNGIYVAALSQGSNFMTSPDGITWTARTRPTQMLTGSSSTQNFEVAFGNGYFVATGENSGNSNMAGVWYSTDGINWTANNVQTTGTGYNATVAYGSIGGTNYWVAAGATSSVTNAAVWYSTNGTTWTLSSNTYNSLSGYFDSVAVGNGVMVLCSSNTSTVPRVTSNPTTATATTVGTGLPNGGYLVTFDGTFFLARDKNSGLTWRSTNGATWWLWGIIPQATNQLAKKQIAFDGTRYLAPVCDGATNSLFTSTDGTGGTQINFSLFTDAYATIN